MKDSNTIAQLQRLSSAQVPLQHSPEEPIEFPHFARSAAFDAISVLTESIETSIKAPFPSAAHWFIRQLPYMRKARADKEKLLTDMMREAIKRITTGEQAKHSALDDVLL